MKLSHVLGHKLSLCKISMCPSNKTREFSQYSSFYSFFYCFNNIDLNNKWPLTNPYSYKNLVVFVLLIHTYDIIIKIVIDSVICICQHSVL